MTISPNDSSIPANDERRRLAIVAEGERAIAVSWTPQKCRVPSPFPDLEDPMIPLPRVRLLLSALAVTALVALGGCSSSSGNASSTSTTAAPTTSSGAPQVQTILDKVGETVLDQSITYPVGDTQVTSSVLTFAPGARTSVHRHDAPMYVYVMEGTITVHYDGDIVKQYTAGSAILEAIGTTHWGENTTDSIVKLLVVNIGADGVANTVNL